MQLYLTFADFCNLVNASLLPGEEAEEGRKKRRETSNDETMEREDKERPQGQHKQVFVNFSIQGLDLCFHLGYQQRQSIVRVQTGPSTIEQHLNYALLLGSLISVSE
jgi:hypothetical protein